MARPVRFLHSADFHLGAGFIGAQLRNQNLGLRLRDAVKDAYLCVIDTALEEKVDFVVLAGDLFDVTENNYRAQGLLIEGLERLNEHDIQVYLVAGNHDPLNGSDRLSLPQNVQIFGSEGVQEMRFEKDGVQPCLIYGRSYPTAAVRSNYAQGFKRGACPNAIGILHTNVGTVSADDRYASCSLDDLRAAQMDYWALGHIHMTNVLSENKPCALYAGSPQALNINETGPHGCYIVELDEGSVSYRFVSTNLINMLQCEIDIEGAEDEDTLRQRVSALLAVELDESETKTLVRITLTGISSLPKAIDDTWLESFGESLESALSGPFPQVFLDTTIKNQTIDSVKHELAENTNEFIGTVIKMANDAETGLCLEDLFTEKNLADFAKNFPQEFSELIDSVDKEEILSSAQELLYRKLLKGSN